MHFFYYFLCPFIISILLCSAKYFYMDKNKALESVNEIKELMEKSSKFVSLSGITAVMAGVYSFVGAYVVGRVFNSEASLAEMVVVASLVLMVSVITACVLSVYKAKKTGTKLFSRLTYRTAWNFSLPLLVGGLFCIALLLHENYGVFGDAIVLRIVSGECIQVYLFQCGMAGIRISCFGNRRLFL